MKKNYLTALFLLTVSISFSQIPSYVPTSGLAGWYSFTGNANDLSGNNNNGVDTGATLTLDRFGNYNCAYSFNGVSSFISMSNTTSLNITGSISLSCWVAPKAPIGGGYGRIIDKGVGNTSTGYVIDINSNGNVRFIGGNQNLYSRASLDTTAWNNVVVIYNYTLDSCVFYINGIRDTVYTGLSGGITSDITPLNVGSAAASGGFPRGAYFLGKIDDIGIWNRALSATEAIQLYSAPACTYTDTIHVTVHDTITSHITVYDTATTHISVTDTLYINAHLTGILPPNNINELKVYPNPAKTDLYIDCGNYATMTGYTIKVTNSIGQTVFITPVSQQRYDVNLSTWSGQGIYILSISDATNTVISTKEIVIQ